MNFSARCWTSSAILPPRDCAVEARLEDGTSDLLLWTGRNWLPDPGRRVTSWRQLMAGNGGTVADCLLLDTMDSATPEN